MPVRRLTPSGEDDKLATLTRIRSFWEKLSGPERQQILFIDDPDLVKQLYKLNLSLLCVGLMQRHLKAPAKSMAVASKANSDSTSTAPDPAAATSESKQLVASTDEAEKKAAVQSTAVAPPEKAYELLEAMEFMDIGTGTEPPLGEDLKEVTELTFNLGFIIRYLDGQKRTGGRTSTALCACGRRVARVPHDCARSARGTVPRALCEGERSDQQLGGLRAHHRHADRAGLSAISSLTAEYYWNSYPVLLRLAHSEELRELLGKRGCDPNGRTAA